MKLKPVLSSQKTYSQIKREVISRMTYNGTLFFENIEGDVLSVFKLDGSFIPTSRRPQRS